MRGHLLCFGTIAYQEQKGHSYERAPPLMLGLRESMVDCLRDQLIPPASLLVSRRGFSRAWKPGDEPVGSGWSRRQINHGLPFSPVNYLFEIYLFHRPFIQ